MDFPRFSAKVISSPHNSSYQFLKIEASEEKSSHTCRNVTWSHQRHSREAILLAAGMMQNWWKWKMCNPLPSPSVVENVYKFLKRKKILPREKSCEFFTLSRDEQRKWWGKNSFKKSWRCIKNTCCCWLPPPFSVEKIVAKSILRFPFTWQKKMKINWNVSRECRDYTKKKSQHSWSDIWHK